MGESVFVTKRTFYQFIMGDAVPQTPWDLTHYGQKHGKRGSASHTAPMLKPPTAALGLLPSRALSSELVKTTIAKIYKNAIINGLPFCGNIIDEAITWWKYDLLMRQHGNFNCRYRKKIFVVDQKGERTRKRTFYFKIVVMGIESEKVLGGGDENVLYI